MKGDLLRVRDKWVERHPDWFEQLLIDLDNTSDGWAALIDDAFGTAEQLVAELPCVEFRVVQIKEKSGALRLYCRQLGMPAAASDRLRDAMHAVRETSLRICERRGASAKLGSDR